MLFLIETAIALCFFAFLTIMFWSVSPLFALFALVCIGVAGWLQWRYFASPPQR